MTCMRFDPSAKLVEPRRCFEFQASAYMPGSVHQCLDILGQHSVGPNLSSPRVDLRRSASDCMCLYAIVFEMPLSLPTVQAR